MKGKIIQKPIYVSKDIDSKIKDAFILVNKTKNKSSLVNDPLLGKLYKNIFNY